MVAYLILILSLLVVSKAADWFLQSAERVGAALRLSPFILGMVLVGFGTSLPELATSMAAVLDGTHNVTLPNVIGSNLVNILVTVGIVSFILGTIRFEKDLIDIDLPLLSGSTALFALLVIDGSLSRVEAVLLLVGFAGYLLYALLYKEGKEFHKGLIFVVSALTQLRRDKAAVSTKSLKLTWIAAMIGSLLLLAGASKLAVDSVIDIARETGVLVDVVSFFAIAIGTSLPELIVSLRAVRQGKGDIALGNIIGSSVFNLLFVGGIAGAVSTQYIDSSLTIWTVGGLGLSALLITLSGITKRIHAWEGFMFLLVYAAISMRILAQ